MRKSTVLSLPLLASSVLLSACSTMVDFSSEPSGAAVTYQGKEIGVTPFQYQLKDQFGWFSVYEFTANKSGFQPSTLVFKEATPMDNANAVPPVVKFELKK